MTTEKFANLAETNLASAYSAAGASITVNDPSLFPTVGNFRVRLGNGFRTLLRVTAVAGATFTVTAEFNDGAAPIGTAVVLVNTAGAEDARKADIHQLLDYASLPASEKAGIVIYPNDSPFIARDHGAGFNYFGPIWKCTPLDQSGWTWVNQGGFSVVQANGIVFLSGPGAVGTNVRGRHTTAPATPYSIEIGVMPIMPQANSPNLLQFFGLLFRESGTGKLIVLIISNFDANSASQQPTVHVLNYNSPTSFSTAEFTRFVPGMPGLIWLRMTDNGTNLVFEFSMDRVNWFTIQTVGRTVFMAGGPDQYGISGTNQGGNIIGGASFISLVQG